MLAYRTAKKFGGELNLVVWRLAIELTINFPSIFSDLSPLSTRASDGRVTNGSKTAGREKTNLQEGSGSQASARVNDSGPIAGQWSSVLFLFRSSRNCPYMAKLGSLTAGDLPNNQTESLEGKEMRVPGSETERITNLGLLMQTERHNSCLHSLHTSSNH